MANNLGTTLYDFTKNNSMFTESEKTYSAFAGADIVAYMGHRRIATLQGITVSITREINPVFVMGDPNPKAFTKGKRAIAGNLVFTQFDKHAILQMAKLWTTKPNFIGDLNTFTQRSYLTQYLNAKSNIVGQSATSYTTLPTLIDTSTISGAQKMQNAIMQEMAETYALVATRKFNYADQVPPMDITITLGNEMGQMAYTAVHGVQLVNEGFGYSIDDLSSEAAFTFVAKGVTALTDQLSDGSVIYSNQSTSV